jgi:hypothetical protein
MTLVMRRLLLPAILVGAVAFSATVWVHAHSGRLQKSPEPTVISGPDIGFRVERNWGGKPVGTLVVRINGEWKEVQFAPRAQVATP